MFGWRQCEQSTLSNSLTFLGAEGISASTFLHFTGLPFLGPTLFWHVNFKFFLICSLVLTWFARASFGRPECVSAFSWTYSERFFKPNLNSRIAAFTLWLRLIRSNLLLTSSKSFKSFLSGRTSWPAAYLNSTLVLLLIGGCPPLLLLDRAVPGALLRAPDCVRFNAATLAFCGCIWECWGFQAILILTVFFNAWPTDLSWSFVYLTWLLESFSISRTNCIVFLLTMP